MNRRIAVALLAVVGLLFSQLPASAATRTYTLFAAHPSVVAQPDSGKPIKDIGVDTAGNLYLGYGDWTANTGPIDVARVSPSGVSSVAVDNVPTEAIINYRNINGVLYAPETDPRTAWTAPAGYATNQGGSWHQVRKTPGQHFFDVARAGNGDLVLTGSRSFPDGSEAGAVAYVSKDNGSTWSIGATAANSPPSGWERYYWAGTIAGKVYIQAGSLTGAKVQVYDGSRWSKSRASVPSITQPNRVASFNGLIYLGDAVFDGKKVSRWVNPATTDFFQSGSYLYAVNGNGVVYRTDGRSVRNRGSLSVTWTLVHSPATALPATVGSLAVANGRVYLGLANGEVWSAPL